jgi:hypothetical protein
MAFPAFRSVGIRKTDGLLARVGELWGIVRASYLSPFFPLVLGFELWLYVRQQLQIGNARLETILGRTSADGFRGCARTHLQTKSRRDG